MKVETVIKSFGKLAEYIIWGKRTPITVSYLSTYSCNQKCRYCNWEKMNQCAMNTEQAVSLIKDLKNNGVVKLGFAGGESLCRKDIDILLKTAHESGLITSLSSNGKEIINHIDSIKRYVDVVQVSIDGSEDIHDYMRGTGSYKKVIEAIRALNENDIKVVTNTVLSKNNLHELNHVIDLARQYGNKALFQPLFCYELSEANEVVDSMQPTYFEIYHAVEYLIDQKRLGKPVGNSVAFLRYIQRSWNKKQPVKCYANNLFCAIDPLGYIMPCCFDIRQNDKCNAITQGFRQAFNNCKSNKFPVQCPGCYCNAYMESNLVFSLDVTACLNAINII